MGTGKVLSLYMTMPDMMRSGHRMACDDIECDQDGIVGDRDHGTGEQKILLVSRKSYEIIEEAELVLDQGVLMENIYTDIDLYHLRPGSVLEIGETLFEVTGPCEAYGYLYAFAPELPELLKGKRGLFIAPVMYGKVCKGDSVTIIKEA